MKKFLSFLLAFLILISIIPISALAAEATSSATFTYMRKGSWKSFNGTVSDNNYIDGIKIQTPTNKSYYLNYRTYNETKGAYYPYVTSIENDYAGSSGKRIQRLQIQVIDKATGNKLATKIVVMYRVRVENNWLPWVSNADPEWMYFVQRKYGIKGVLDTKSAYAGLAENSYITGIEIHIYEETSVSESKGTAGISKLIDAPFISQLNSYPTGCESVSAVMGLNYLGFDITVDGFIDNYLPQGSASSFDPNVCFGGNPRSQSGMGCYAPVIEKASKSALDGYGVTVIRHDNLSISNLCQKYIDNDIPVIIWATQDMQTPRNGVVINYNNTNIQWIAPEHCLLLVGYNENNYIFNDPLKSKNYSYSRSAVENAYYGLGAQAVVFSPISANSTVSEEKYEFIPEDIPTNENIGLSDGSFNIEIPLVKSEKRGAFNIKAIYSSSGLVEDSLGTGWYYNFQKHIAKSGENLLVFSSPSHYSVYTPDGNGGYFNFKNGYTVSSLNEGGYCLNRNFGGYEYYDAQGKLCKLQDKQGFETVINYFDDSVTITDTATKEAFVLNFDSKGRIVKVVNSSLSASLKYTANVLTDITDSFSNSYHFKYDNSLRLISITGAITHTVNYNSEGRISKLDSTVISYNNNTVTVNSDSKYSFNSNGTLAQYSNNTDSLDFGYDNTLCLTSVTSSKGTTYYEYNDYRRPSVITYDHGGKSYYFYDDLQNLIKTVEPLKGDVNENGIVEITDFIKLKAYLSNNANITVSEYNSTFSNDGIGADDLSIIKKLLLTESKLTSITEYLYNSRNQLTQIHYPDNTTEHFYYDEYGNTL